MQVPCCKPPFCLGTQADKCAKEELLTPCLRAGLPVDTDNLARLNDDANVGEAVSYLVMALQHWGVVPTLNFQRGGTPL